MFLWHLSLFLIWLQAAKASTLQQQPLFANSIIDPQHLRLSAVVNEDHPPYHATIECWELTNPFHSYPTIGTSLQLANISDLTYVTIPPNSSEGLHHPPHPMFFILLAGVAHVTLPAYPESEGLWIREGVNPVIVATDVLGMGHDTFYPGGKATVALQAPFRDGVVPEHRIVGEGPCYDDDAGRSGE